MIDSPFGTAPVTNGNRSFGRDLIQVPAFQSSAPASPTAVCLAPAAFCPLPHLQSHRMLFALVPEGQRVYLGVGDIYLKEAFDREATSAERRTYES